MNIGSFSTGISWEYYRKDRSNNPLFVIAKFENLKEEIFNYTHLHIGHYKTEILPKVNAFQQTKTEKHICGKSSEI